MTTRDYLTIDEITQSCKQITDLIDIEIDAFIESDNQNSQTLKRLSTQRNTIKRMIYMFKTMLEPVEDEKDKFNLEEEIASKRDINEFMRDTGISI